MGWSQWWFTAGVLLFTVEILTPGGFFFACLGVGALAAGCSVLLGPSMSWWFHWVVFSVFSVISIYFIRPIARKYLTLNFKKTNVDALIGQKAWVTEAIEPPHLGTVKVEGEIWRAESAEKIEAQTTVEVVSVKGTRLEVKKI